MLRETDLRKKKKINQPLPRSIVLELNPILITPRLPFASTKSACSTWKI